MARLFAVLFMMMFLNLVGYTQDEVPSTPTIIAKSPFLPPNFQPPGGPGKVTEPPTQQAAYEFRGVYQLGGTYYFNLYNKSENKGTWIAGLDGGNDTLDIVEFDPSGNKLVINVDGEDMNLSLIETSDKSIPVASGPRTAQTTTKRTTTTTKRNNTVRRRVIRPSNRSPNSPPTTGRRRIIRPTSNP